MPMSRRDAELRFDGRIPPGEVDDSLPDRLLPVVAVRLGQITEKPESIVRRMAVAIATVATSLGTVTEDNLRHVGFTTEQIRAHKDDALARAMVIDPFLPALAMEHVHG